MHPSTKGYKLYNLDTKTLFHSRDVLFSENIFPFKIEGNIATLESKDTIVHVNACGEPFFTTYDSDFPNKFPSSSSTTPSLHGTPITSNEPISQTSSGSSYI